MCALRRSNGGTNSRARAAFAPSGWPSFRILSPTAGSIWPNTHWARFRSARSVLGTTLRPPFQHEGGVNVANTMVGENIVRKIFLSALLGAGLMLSVHAADIVVKLKPP